MKILMKITILIPIIKINSKEAPKKKLDLK